MQVHINRARIPFMIPPFTGEAALRADFTHFRGGKNSAENALRCRRLSYTTHALIARTILRFHTVVPGPKHWIYGHGNSA